MTDRIFAALCGHVSPTSLKPTTETAAEHCALPGKAVSKLGVASPNILKSSERSVCTKFDELPDGWRDASLSDPDLAGGVLDLMTDDAQRRGGCLTMLLCNLQGQLLQSVVICDVPAELSPQLKSMTVERVMEVVGDPSLDLRLAVVMGIGSDRPAVTGEDHEWAHLIRSHTAQLGVSLLGIYALGEGMIQRLPH